MMEDAYKKIANRRLGVMYLLITLLNDWEVLSATTE